MDSKPIQFIDENIEVYYKTEPLLEKKPKCPDGFTWREDFYAIEEMLSEWFDFSRKGKNARNMQPAHASHALVKGSWGVGRFFFRVRVATNRIFDIYYDRAPKNVNNRKGKWFVFQERSLEN